MVTVAFRTQSNVQDVFPQTDEEQIWKAVRTTWKLLDTTLARTLIITLDGFSCELKIS